MAEISRLEEDFALACGDTAARSKVVAQATSKGSLDWYRYHGLVLLQELDVLVKDTTTVRAATEQERVVMDKIKQHLQMLASKANATAVYDLLLSRFRLLTWFIDQEEAAKFVNDKLQLRLPKKQQAVESVALAGDESRDLSGVGAQEDDEMDAAPQKMSYPSALEPSVLDERAFFKELLANDDYFGVHPAMWTRVIKHAWPSLPPSQKIKLLENIANTPMPDELDIGELYLDCCHLAKDARAATMAFHQFTLPQLEKLLAKADNPLFKDNHPGRDALITCTMQKLVPTSLQEPEGSVPNITGWNALDSDDGRAYLASIDALAAKIPDGRSIQACVSFYRLRAALFAKQFDPQLLLTYLSQSMVKKGADPVKSPKPSTNSVFQAFGTSRLNNYYSSLHIPLLGPCDIRDDDEQYVIKQYLRGLLVERKVADLAVFGTYLDTRHFLAPLEAEIQLTSELSVGKDTSAMLATYNRSAPSSQLVKQSYIKFGHQSLHDAVNETKPTAPLSLHVILKNIPRLTMRVFPMDLFNYWKGHTAALNMRNVGKISLDGLQPLFEHDFDYADLPALRIHEHAFQLDDLCPDLFTEKRGAWLIDLVGGGHQSRAIVHKGYLRHFSQKTSAGHLFMVLDEQDKPQRCRIWYEKAFYDPDVYGNILIPYRGGDSKMGRCLLLTGDGFCQPLSFYHEAESYNLMSTFYINNESLIPNKLAKVVLKPTLTANGRPCSLKLLEQVSLNIVTSTTSGIPSHTKVSDVPIVPDGTIEYAFTVPTSVASIDITLEAKVKKLNGEFKTLTCQSNYSQTANNSTSNVYMRHDDEKGYVIHVLGKNGEPVPDKKLDVAITLQLFAKEKNVTMQTDKDGKIHLGHLADASMVAVTTEFYKQWPIDRGVQTRLPDNLQAKANTPLRLPFRPTFYQWQLYTEGSFGNPVTNVSSLLSFTSTTMEIPSGLPKGSYTLLTSPNDRIRIKILEDVIHLKDNPAWKHWVLDERQAIDTSGSIMANPLAVSKIDVDDKRIAIELDAAAPATYAVVASNVFLPNSGDGVFARIEDYVADVQRKYVHTYGMSAFASTFLTGRTLSEEYQYILNRAKEPKFIGSTLPDPSLLIYPEKQGKTTATTRATKQGNNAYLEKTRGSGNRAANKSLPYGIRAAKANCMMMSAPCAANDLDFGFLQQPSSVFIVPIIDNQCEIPLMALGQGNIVQVALLGPNQVAGLSVSMPIKEPLATFDNRRLNHGLHPEGNYVRTKTTTLLSPHAPHTQSLELNAATHEFEILSSQNDILRLMKLLAPNCADSLQKFTPALMNWPSLSLHEKHEKHAKLNCHEFNLWLKQKDTHYFDTYIKPCIQDKLQHSFMDTYLLDGDVSKYAERMVYFKRLTVFEKALLCKRVPSVIPAVKQIFTAQIKKVESHQAFETVLAGRALDAAPSSETREPVVEMELMMSYSVDQVMQRGERLDALQDRSAALGGNFGAPPPPPPMTRPAPQARGSLFGAAPRAGAFSFGSAPAPQVQQQQMQQQQQAATQRVSGFGGFGAVPAAPASATTGSHASSEDDDADADADFDMLDDDSIMETSTSDNDEGDDYEEQLREQAKLRLKARKPYSYMDVTFKWKEQGYYETQQPTSAKVSPFWLDYIENDLPLFVSKNIIHATSSITEVLMALAVSDLPFKEQADHALTADGGKITVCAKTTPVLAFCRDLRMMDKDNAKHQANILISQSFFDKNEFSNVDANTRLVEPDQMLTNTPYGWHVAVTNVTPKPIECEMTLQVPPGSLPLMDTRPCISKSMVLQPYSTRREVIGTFYFPSRGTFQHFSVTLSSPDDAKQQAVELLAASAPMALVVSDVNALNDANVTQFKRSLSWPIVAANASDRQVLDFIKDNEDKLSRLDWSLILTRMTKPAFAEPLLDLCHTVRFYDKRLYAYGLYHGWTNYTIDLLQQEAHSLLDRTGPVFECPLLRWHQHDYSLQTVADYLPLVNARAHDLSTNLEISNHGLAEQYRVFIQCLAVKTALSTNDHLMLVVYLLAQGRLFDAHRAHDKLKAHIELHGGASIQSDYLEAYLATRPAVGDVIDWARVKAIVAKYECVTSKHWKQRFDALASLARKVGRDVDDMDVDDTIMSENAADADANLRRDPVFDFNIQDGRVVLRTLNVSEAQVRFYKINAEVMFSNEPFLSQAHTKSSQISWFQANHVETIDFTRPLDEIDNVTAVENADDVLLSEWIAIHKAKPTQCAIPIPLKGNLLIEVHAHGRSQRQTYMSNDLVVHVSEGYGIARVTKDQKALPGVYVKVYASLKANASSANRNLFGNTTKTVEFWKDGYTSLTGVFDYVSVSQGNALVGSKSLKDVMADVDKFSLLFSSPEHGVVVKEAVPPL